MKLTLRNICLSCACALSYLTSGISVSAQIVPDKTLPVNSTVTTTGLLHTINGGTTVGVNLYHSFQDFSVPTNNTAYFNNAANVQNVMARVTGSSISNIDGTLKANGNTNLYLLNPNGIAFGANAKLDIGGSFVGSTANGFKFPDGSEFSATNPQAPLPLLTMSITPGLQYGTSNVGATISNRGNLIAGQDLVLNADKLDLQGSLQATRDLSLQAQDVVKIRDTVTTPFVVTSGRDTTIQGNNSVDILALNNPLTQIESGGNLSLISDGTISGDAHLLSGGNLTFLTTTGGFANFVSKYDPIIYANGDVTFGNYTGTALKVEATGSIQGGNITITAPDTSGAIPVSDRDFTTLTTLPSLILRAGVASVTSNVPQTTGGTTFTSATLGNPVGSITVGSINTSVAAGNGNGGDVILSATQNVVTGNIRTYGGVIGNSGNITINAKSLSYTNGTALDASTKGQGNAGNISITASDLVSFDTGSLVLSNVINGAVGNAGNVTINAGSLAVNSGAQLEAITYGQGNAGNIIINAADTVLFSGRSSNNIIFASAAGTTIESTGVGNGGNITINARSVSFLNGARLEASTTGTGNAGNITINATDNVLLSGINSGYATEIHSDVNSTATGNAGTVTINASSVSLTNGAILQSNTYGNGNAGNVNINASGLVTLDASVAISNVALGAIGNAGNVTVNASSVSLINNGAQIESNTLDNGNAGNVTVNASSVSLINVALIGSYTFVNNGNAGNVTVNASSVSLTDGAQISSSTFGNGNGGNVTVNASSVSLTNGAQISSGTRGNGNGGDITIIAQTLDILGGNSTLGFTTGVGASTFSTGNAGKIAILLGQSLLLDSSRGLASIETATSTGSTGNGGSIFIDPQNITLQNGALITATSLGAGIGGDINIFSNNLFLLNRSNINAKSFNANGGNINLNIPSLLLLRYASNINATAGFASPNASGNGGNITINAGFVVAVCTEDSNIYANASIGHGGNITINANAVYGLQYSPQLTSPLSEIVANNITGTLPGTVTLNTLNFDPIRGVTVLPNNLADPSKQVSQTCAVGGKLSNRNNSLIITGRGGLPKSPSDELSINRSLVEPVDSLPSSSDRETPPVKKTEVNPDTPKRIIEANTVIRDSRGILRLVAAATPLNPAIPPLNCSQ